MKNEVLSATANSNINPFICRRGRGARCVHTHTAQGAQAAGAETGRAPAPLLLNCVIHFLALNCIHLLGRTLGFLGETPNRKRNESTALHALHTATA